MTCPTCRKPAGKLYQIPGGEYVCICCVPESAFAGYPGWKKRAAALIKETLTMRKRGEQARKNFGHKEARA